MQTIQLKFNVTCAFPVIFTRKVFDPENQALVQVLQKTGRTTKVLVVIDANVVAADPRLINRIEAFAQRHGHLVQPAAPPCIVPGGEACKKGTAAVKKILSFINNYGLCRHSVVMVIGGGAVLDAAGFAVAIAHRGLRLIRLPTTTLAQNDAGVGVKNGLNLFGKKNFIGTFVPPFAVVNDFDFLATLSERDCRAGIAEAVKVALIKDRSFFDFLYTHRKRLQRLEPEVMEEMITRCARLHMEHIQTNGDPFEQGAARPLDFGHWAGHKIEDLTEGEVRHGEAVAVGIALDAVYAFLCNMLTEIELHKILSLLRTVGFDLFHPVLHRMNLSHALNHFREHMGGELTIPLISGIGRLTIVDRIDLDLMDKAVTTLCAKHDQKGARNGYSQHSHVG